MERPRPAFTSSSSPAAPAAAPHARRWRTSQHPRRRRRPFAVVLPGSSGIWVVRRGVPRPSRPAATPTEARGGWPGARSLAEACRGWRGGGGRKGAGKGGRRRRGREETEKGPIAEGFDAGQRGQKRARVLGPFFLHSLARGRPDLSRPGTRPPARPARGHHLPMLLPPPFFPLLSSSSPGAFLQRDRPPAGPRPSNPPAAVGAHGGGLAARVEARGGEAGRMGEERWTWAGRIGRAGRKRGRKQCKMWERRCRAARRGAHLPPREAAAGPTPTHSEGSSTTASVITLITTTTSSSSRPLPP